MGNITTISTQKEWDDLPDKFGEFTRIEIRADEQIVISNVPDNSRADLRGNSRADLRGNSRAVLWENSPACL